MVINKMNKKNKIGIYVHIPFCAKKCFYCDFVSYENKVDIIEEYIQALKKEIINAKTLIKNSEIDTIYIGGGTPSFISSKYIVSILNSIRENYSIEENAEITIEVNPGTVTKKKFSDYKENGINRISIGLQTTNDMLLKQIGRIHSYEQFMQTYNLAREIGFENINVDLMLGLPNQTMEDLVQSVNNIVKIDPEHISVYSLILEQGTKLYELVENRKIDLLDEELERKMYWYVKNKLEAKGYNHYEISNFSKKGYASKHNLHCWEQREYIGFGVAAHSYYNNTRYSNTENLQEYIKNASSIIHEIQTKEEQKKEYMLLGLRKIEGVKISKFKNKFIQNPLYIFRKELEKLVKAELIEIDIDSIKLTKKGIDLANIVWEEFI